MQDTWGDYQARKRQKNDGGKNLTVKKAKKTKKNDWNPFEEDDDEFGKRTDRAQRFEKTLKNSKQQHQQSKNAAEAYDKMKERALGKKQNYWEEYTDIKVVGACEELEKQYSRLTSVRICEQLCLIGVNPIIFSGSLCSGS